MRGNVVLLDSFVGGVEDGEGGVDVGGWGCHCHRVGMKLELQLELCLCLPSCC